MWRQHFEDGQERFESGGTVLGVGHERFENGDSILEIGHDRLKNGGTVLGIWHESGGSVFNRHSGNKRATSQQHAARLSKGTGWESGRRVLRMVAVF